MPHFVNGLLATAATPQTGSDAGARAAAVVQHAGSFPPILVYAAFCAIGLVLAAAVLSYLIRTNRQPLTLIKGVAGGGLSAATIAAAGTRISGVAFPFTWAEAALLTILSFVASLAVLGIGALGLFWWLIVRPITQRYGQHHGVRVWTEFWAGIEPLRVWITRTIRDVQADESWDEFACAFEAASREIEGVDEGSDVTERTINTWGRLQEEFLPPDGDACRVILDAVEIPIMLLTSRLTLTTLNFTVWRIHEKDDVLEHLLSMPVDQMHDAGLGHKKPLPIWLDPKKSRPGSLAGDALLTGEYKSMTTGERLRSYPRRGMGTRYDSVAAMPVPCDGEGEAPWAVVCVETRDGCLPIHSHTMRLFMAKLARVVHATAEVACRRTIDEARAVIRSDVSGKSEMSEPTTPPVSSPKPKPNTTSAERVRKDENPTKKPNSLAEDTREIKPMSQATDVPSAEEGR